MLNVSLLKNIFIIAISSSIISTELIQKIKESTKCRKWFNLKSFIISMLIGICFTYSFSTIDFIYSLWVGLISYIGADVIYKTFEDKIFKSFSDLEDTTLIERTDKK